MNNDMKECTCSHLFAGSIDTGAKNWNSKCPIHGLASDWYSDADQVRARTEAKEVLRRLQTSASFTRKGVMHNHSMPADHIQKGDFVENCPNCEAVKKAL